jgi:hypothetical protein
MRLISAQYRMAAGLAAELEWMEEYIDVVTRGLNVNRAAVNV